MIIVPISLLFFIGIDGVDKDFFENLWKDLKQPALQNSKIGQIFIKKEKNDFQKENYDKQNRHKFVIKTENCRDEEMEDIKPKILKDNNEFNATIIVPKSEEAQIMKISNTKSANQKNTKQKLGQRKNRPLMDEKDKQTKMELIREFDKRKKEKIYGFKYDRQTCTKTETEIAKNMGTSRDKIYQWKRDLGGVKHYSDEQKREIIEQFENIKEAFTKKFNLKTSYGMNTKIAKKIGVDVRKIYRWQRKFGIIKKKWKTNAEKMEIVKKYDEIKNANPSFSDRKIAKQLAIDHSNLRAWRKRFSSIKQK